MNILFRNYIPKLYNELENLYTDNDWKNLRIILFGMNKPIEFVYSFFEKKNIPVQSIIDNDKSKHGNKCGNCTISSPYDALHDIKEKENVIILIASGAYKEMKKQILDMGYNEVNIYIIKNFFYDPKKIERFPLSEEYRYEELSLQNIQNECFKMLKYIKHFCEKRNIKYFLSYGTLLGAVRHKGFIPWDDDIDISMPWDDYIKFCREFEDTQDYVLISMLRENAYEIPCNSVLTRVMNKNIITERTYFPIYSRQGICIDIFPINGYPDTLEEQNKYENEIEDLYILWRNQVRYKLGTNEYSKDIHENLWKQMLAVMTRYKYDKSNYVGSVCSLFNHSIAPRDKYEIPSRLSFENEEFMVPGDYDYILTKTYGNYMQLPKAEQRKPKHFLNTYRIVKQH